MVVASATDALRVELRGDPEAACIARAMISEMFADDLPAPALHDLHLLATELVTNAVLHARAGTIELAVEMVRAGVRVSVTDPGCAGTPHVEELDPDVPGGMGLFLVEQISSRWGVDKLATGENRVWFELAA